MQTKNTDDLFEILSEENTNYDTFVEDESNNFVNNNIKSFWSELLDKCEYSNVDVINKSEISYAYFYDIICGKKSPTRDKIIKIVLSMGLTVDDCQRALKLYEWAPLYARSKRDSAIIFAFQHNFSLIQLNELMIKNSIKLL